MTAGPKTAKVLAAGLGTRMRPLTDRLPKALVPVAGRALIDRVLDKLVEAGVERAVVNVHHFAEQVEAHLRGRGDVEVLFSDERAGLLDSGGGIQHARALLGEDPIFVANIDSLWLEGETPALEALKRAWDPSRMDLLLSRPSGLSLGYSLNHRDSLRIADLFERSEYHDLELLVPLKDRKVAEMVSEPGFLVRREE